MEFDLVLTGGEVCDGTGTPARRADVGLREGRIVAVSEAPLDAAEVIDCTGRTISPGFIDLHSHADFAIEGTPAATTQLAQGVTTLVTGNCGSSPFPVEDLGALKDSSSFLRPELSWQWNDLAGYRRAIDQQHPGVRIAPQVGHGALRIAVLGHADRQPDADELRRMCDLLRIAAEQGAVGFSTGLIYAPGSYAETAEVDALVATAAECGLLYSTHMRNESDHVLDAVDEAIGTARRTGVRLEISHIKAMGPRNHGTVPRILERIDAARAEGIDVAGDVYPYTASSTTLTSRLPLWSMAGGVEALLSRLADAGDHARIHDELAARFDGEIDPAGVVIADLPAGEYSDRVNQSLTEIADGLDIDPAEAALRVLAAHRGTVAIVNHAMAESDLRAALVHPEVSIASDGWVLELEGPGHPHPRSFGTFARVLGHYVREGVLSLPEAVRKMTTLPASRLHWTDRGVIAEGAVADLVVFDPASVVDNSTYAEPWQLAGGVTEVLIGGLPAWRDGRPTPERVGGLTY